MTETSIPATSEQRHKDFIDGLKLFHELFKHLTSLSAGSLLLLATLLDRLFQSPTWTPLIGVAFVGFAVSLVGSIASMIAFARATQMSGDIETKNTVYVPSVVAALAGFAVGLGGLSVFSLKNFYN